MLLFLIYIFLFVSVVFIFIYLRQEYPPTIKVKTIHMQKPNVATGVERKPWLENAETKNLVALETDSRKLAYKNSSLKTDSSFFDDSDMLSDYYLIVVYDQKLNGPLLTARYYFDKTVIAKCLKGEMNSPSLLDPGTFKEKKLFLSDRLSGNVNSALYRKHRDYIYLLFYKEIYIQNKNCKFILMARKERFEKLLTKYLRLGLHIIGTNIHKEKEHWILLGDMQKNKTQLKASLLSTLYLLIKT